MDESTRQQLDELRPQLDARRRLRAAHQRRYDALAEQAATWGRGVAVEVVQELTDLAVTIKAVDAEIREIEARIIRLETAPAPDTVLMIPDEAPRVPTLVPALVDDRLRAQDRALEWVREVVTEIRRDVAKSRQESLEWRTSETRQREEGMRAHQDHHSSIRLVGMVSGAAVLIILVLLIIEVFVK